MTLRERMTNAIARGAWLDWAYKRQFAELLDERHYRAWLDSLDDDDFLDSYDRVTKAESELD